jgi:hypothetical protein
VWQALTKDDCNRGGWEIFGIFKNQGLCLKAAKARRP